MNKSCQCCTVSMTMIADQKSMCRLVSFLSQFDHKPTLAGVLKLHSKCMHLGKKVLIVLTEALSKSATPYSAGEGH